jgi:hypothetical protein
MVQYVSCLNRVLYFSIPEQRTIFKAIRVYLENNPEDENAKVIYKDFYREQFNK